MKKLVFTILLFLILNISVLAQESKSPSPIANNDQNNAIAQKERITQLEGEVFWLGLLAAMGFILPVPLGFYHIYRTRELLAQIGEMQVKFDEQNNKLTQVNPLMETNRQLQEQLRQVQENFRVAMKSNQEKHQEAIEKLKTEMHFLELENKRISGVLMLKEQVAKRSSPGS
ncbi:MAG: hypothetical protein WAQ98_10155 [Blastocatellia bacterium]